VPVAWALLPDKKTTTYDMMWREIKKLVDLEPGTPARLYMDFEWGAWNASIEAMGWIQVFI
jgi:hypothetical protein